MRVCCCCRTETTKEYDIINELKSNSLALFFGFLAAVLTAIAACIVQVIYNKCCTTENSPNTQTVTANIINSPNTTFIVNPQTTINIEQSHPASAVRNTDDSTLIFLQNLGDGSIILLRDLLQQDGKVVFSSSSTAFSSVASSSAASSSSNSTAESEGKQLHIG